MKKAAFVLLVPILAGCANGDTESPEHREARMALASLRQWEPEPCLSLAPAETTWVGVRSYRAVQELKVEAQNLCHSAISLYSGVEGCETPDVHINVWAQGTAYFLRRNSSSQPVSPSLEATRSMECRIFESPLTKRTMAPGEVISVGFLWDGRLEGDARIQPGFWPGFITALVDRGDQRDHWVTPTVIEIEVAP